MRTESNNEGNESDESNESNNSEDSIKMNDKSNSSFMNSKHQSPNKENASALSSFKQMEDYGILYLKKQQKYLIFRASVPIFSIIIQIFNIFFIMGQFMVENAPMGHMSRGGPSLFDLLSPSFVFLLKALAAPGGGQN